MGCIEAGIDVAADLVARLRKIESDVIALHFDPGLDWNIQSAEAVAIHDVREFVNSVRDLAYGVAHALTGPRDDFIEGFLKRRGGIGLGEFDQPPLTKPACGDLGEIISPALLRHSDVEQKQVENVLHEFAAPEQLHDGDPQPFLKNLGHATGHTARGHAPDVRVVGDGANEGEELASDEDRHRNIDIGQMRPACDVRIVADEDVALMAMLHAVLS